MDEKKILFEVLNIIGYQDNKVEFIQKFFAIIYTEALAELTTSLSDEVQEKLGQELEMAKEDEEAQKAIILKYLSKEEFDTLLTKITQTQFMDYLETIYPTLSADTRETLTAYLSS